MNKMELDIKLITPKFIDINLIDSNNGQVPGVMENPRDLTGEKFEKAKKSIIDFPEMLGFSTLTVIEHNNRYVTIGGNQRLRVLNELGYDRAPCKIVADWSIDKINEFIIKDNLSYGDFNWDLIANEWDTEQVQDWGLELPVDLGQEDPEDIEIVEEFNKAENFIIKCDSLEDFADLQQRFYTTAKSISYKEAIKCLK